ncbi:MAG TPA: ATP-binding protein [Gammaproteobacteria bacterium]
MKKQTDTDKVFAGGGEMGELVRRTDWSKTPLGPVSNWPASLRTMARVMLDNRHPMAVWWGQDFIHLYNDAYLPILGDKHPRSMGQSGNDVWEESWKIIGPMARGVLDGGPATWDEDFLFPVNRRGFLEETHFTFSYSPIPDDAGGIGGVLVTTKETTASVQDDRQMRVLRDLADYSASAEHAGDALQNAARVLGGNNADFPFTLLYLVDEDRRQAQLVSTSGLDEYKGAAVVRTVSLEKRGGGEVWPLARAARMTQPLVIENLSARVGVMRGGRWPEAPNMAIVLPLARPGGLPYGFLVSGVNPRRRLDDRYLRFFRLTAVPIVAAIANARSLEAERERVEALAEIDRVKTAFFSNVSHEFRTPLTLMLGPVEDLLAGVHGKVFGTQRVQLALLHRNALRLQKLVNALLDFSRIESGRIQAAYEPVGLSSLTADTASAFRSAIERAGLEFHVDCSPLDEPVHVDRDMWEKIVLNLISNAFKFTFTGRIDVSLREFDDHVALRVADTGTGISRAELPHLFERFHRVQGARARTHEGSGIGLALVQELARLHGGRVDVQSTVDKGSRFTVTIPKGTAHLPADHVVERTGPRPSAFTATAFVDEAMTWMQDESSDRPPRLSSQDLARRGFMETGLPAFQPKTSGRILLADDNADMLDYIRRILEPYWAVETRRDGDQALIAARATPPDLVLTDVMMPGLDGFELLGELRNDKRTRHIPVIMLSARAGEEARVEGLRAGAEDYLTKPFSARELLARVNTQLEVAKLRRAVEAERKNLENIFSQAPVAISVWRGPQHVFALANLYYKRVFGRPDVIGKTVRDVFPEPELERQGIWKIWDHVYASGETYTNNRFLVHFNRNSDGNGDGKTEPGYFAFTLAALRNEENRVTGLVAVAIEVTEGE